MERFLLRIQEKRVCRDVENRVLWIKLKSISFLSNPFMLPWRWRVQSFLMIIIWRSCIPPKVRFFCLGETYRKALTLDQV